MSPIQKPKMHTIRIVHKGLEKKLRIQQDEFLVGSDESAQVRIVDPAISRKHALINISMGQVFVRDLGSTNGTFINEAKIAPNEDIGLSQPSEMFSLAKVVWISVLLDSTELSSSIQVEAPSRASFNPPDFRRPASQLSSSTNEVLEQLEKQVSDLNSRHASLEADFRVRKLSLDSAINEMELQHSKAKTDLEALLAEQKTVTAETLKLRTETDQHVSALIQQMQTLETDKKNLLDKLERDQFRVEQLRTEMKERELTLATLRKDGDEARAQTTALQDELRRTEATWKETKSQMENDLQTKRQAMERELSQTTARLNSLTEEVNKLDLLIKTENETYQKILETNQREKETLQFELSKQKAAFEVDIAEARIKKLSMEASVGDAEVKYIEFKRLINDLQVQKTEVENETKRLKSEADQHLAQTQQSVQALQGEAQRIEDQIQRLQAQTAEQEINFARATEEFEMKKQQATAAREELAREESILRVFLERSKSERKKMDDASQEVQKRVDQEYEALRKEAQKQLEIDTQSQRAELEKVQNEIREVQKLKQTQLELIRNEAKGQLQAEVEKQKAELQNEFVRRGKQMEDELATVRLRELEKIEKLKEESEMTEKMKRFYIADEIVSTVIDFSKNQTLEGNPEELKKTLLLILNGETRSNVTAQAAQRTRYFWKKVAIFLSVPCAIGIFFTIFPGTFDAIQGGFNRTVASEQKDSGIFLNEIQQKGVRYQPEMDYNFRNSYSENVLYLKDYVEMKQNQEVERKWTLILNDFIVGRLGLSDRIIPNFIANEAVMIRELLTIRNGILPQFKEQGITRMNTTEQIAVGKILEFLQTQDNYQKFRMLEKDFYNEYIKSKASPAAAATVPPISALPTTQ